MKDRVRVHSTLECSEVNGPGKRFVLWTQGCERDCPGCFNQDARSMYAGEWRSVSELGAEILRAVERFNLDGVTFSGGEPMLQAWALVDLLLWLRVCRPERPLSFMLFTGETRNDVLSKITSAPARWVLWNLFDIVVAGPYVEACRFSSKDREDLQGLDQYLGSSNQTVHTPTHRFRVGQVLDAPVGSVEVVFDGTTGTFTGLVPCDCKQLSSQL